MVLGAAGPVKYLSLNLAAVGEPVCKVTSACCMVWFNNTVPHPASCFREQSTVGSETFFGALTSLSTLLLDISSGPRASCSWAHERTASVYGLRSELHLGHGLVVVLPIILFALFFLTGVHLPGECGGITSELVPLAAFALVNHYFGAAHVFGLHVLGPMSKHRWQPYAAVSPHEPEALSVVEPRAVAGHSLGLAGPERVSPRVESHGVGGLYDPRLPARASIHR
jgi:hypothetical protein